MIKEINATLFIEQKVKIFDNGVIEIKDYKKPVCKIKEGYETFEDNEKIGRVSSDKIDNETELRKDSLYRSRSMLIDYANQNESEFTSFITLTFKDNITDISYANKKFNNFITSIKRVYPNFKYLGVPEFQKRGAVHYHLLTNLIAGSDLLPLQENTDNKYDVKYWNYGYSSVFDFKNTDDKFNSVLYIVKYFNKDLDKRLLGRTKVLKSNNLKKPLVIELEKNDDNYNLAESYIDSKGIECTIKEITPTYEYAIPFTITKCKTSVENIENLKAIYEERKNEK